MPEEKVPELDMVVVVVFVPGMEEIRRRDVELRAELGKSTFGQDFIHSFRISPGPRFKMDLCAKMLR